MKRKNGKGFTLIELLIVMIILGLLAALAGPQLFQKVGSSKIKAAEAQINLFETALDMYRLDIGKYPTSEQGLQALREDPGVGGWDGPYLSKEIPDDPWGNDYQYRYPGDHGEFDLFSYGADGEPGGEDENADITNWEG
jgi:general secretion pathway protein G